MTETDEQWVERMLALCDAYRPPVAPFQPGQLLTSRRTARRATVAFCDQTWTSLTFSEDRTLEFPTNHVIKHYRPS